MTARSVDLVSGQVYYYKSRKHSDKKNYDDDDEEEEDEEDHNDMPWKGCFDVTLATVNQAPRTREGSHAPAALPSVRWSEPRSASPSDRVSLWGACL